MRKNFFVKVSAVLSSVIMAAAAGAASVSAASTAVKQSTLSAYAIELTNAETLSGKDVNVDLNIFSDNTCEGFTVTVEFDDRLTFKDISGSVTYAQDENTIEISGFSALGIKDGTVAALTFTAPENYSGWEAYDVYISNVSSFGTLNEEFSGFTVANSRVSVIGKSEKTSNYMVVSNNNDVNLGIRGDFNCDGVTNIFDAVEVAKTNVKKDAKVSALSMSCGDVNEDGMLNIFDAVNIARYTMCRDWSKVLK